MITINITQTQDLRNIKRPWPAKSWTGSLPTPHADQPGGDVNCAASISNIDHNNYFLDQDDLRDNLKADLSEN